VSQRGYDVYVTDIRLSGSEWLAGWRQETGHLLLLLLRPPKLGERIAARVQLTDRPVRATVIGTVASMHQQGEQHRVELALEAESLPAVRLLRAASLGKRFQFSERDVRYLARLPVLVTRGQVDLYATTISVSEGGCALKWPGALPSCGESLLLRFCAGRRTVELDGVVCWVEPGGSAGTAGVRFEATARSTTVASILLEARQNGAPQA
jgi:hypothetical protein